MSTDRKTDHDGRATVDPVATKLSGSFGEGGLAEIPHDLFCQQCGYNLRALISDRCPECGRSLEAVRSPIPEIPWVHRAELGRFRAYWRTVWLVMFRQRSFCDEMARPVSYPDSQSFRWVTIMHVFLPILLAMIALTLHPARSEPFDGGLFDTAFDLVWPVAFMHVCLLLFLAAITGLPSYFFHPRGVPVELQNRAIALSYYACGPLAITALPVMAAVGGYVLGLDHKLGMGLAILAFALPCAQFFAWFVDLLHIVRRILPQNPWRGNLIAACVPLLWFVLGWLLLFALPLVAFVVAIFVFDVG